MAGLAELATRLSAIQTQLSALDTESAGGADAGGSPPSVSEFDGAHFRRHSRVSKLMCLKYLSLAREPSYTLGRCRDCLWRRYVQNCKRAVSFSESWISVVLTNRSHVDRLAW